MTPTIKGKGEKSPYLINPKYQVGDVVLLMNGKMRKITYINITVWDDWHTIEYQGAWYTPVFNQNKVVRKVNN